MTYLRQKMVLIPINIFIVNTYTWYFWFEVNYYFYKLYLKCFFKYIINVKKLFLKVDYNNFVIFKNVSFVLKLNRYW